MPTMATGEQRTIQQAGAEEFMEVIQTSRRVLKKSQGILIRHIATRHQPRSVVRGAEPTGAPAGSRPRSLRLA
jgi:hypothetical protein